MRSRILTVLPVLAFAAGLVLLPAAPAAAHGQLAYSDPAHQSTLTEARQHLALYFTEVPASNAYFSITAPSGGRVDSGWFTGEPKPLPTPVRELNLRGGTWEPQLYHTGFAAMVTVSHWPEKGVYTVKYLSIASDGDRVDGDIRFDYQGTTTAAPAGWTAPTSQPDPVLLGQHAPVATPPAGAQQPAAQPADEGGLGWLVWTVSVVIVLGAVGYLLLRRRPAAVKPNSVRRR